MRVTKKMDIYAPVREKGKRSIAKTRDEHRKNKERKQEEKEYEYGKRIIKKK